MFFSLMKKKRKYAKNRKNVKPVDSARLSKFSMSCVVTVVIVISALCVTGKRSEFAHVNAGNMRSFKEVMNDTSVEPNSNAAVNPCSVPNPFVKRPLDAVVGLKL